MKNKALSLSALVLATGLTLAACSSDDADTDAAATTTESSASDSKNLPLRKQPWKTASSRQKQLMSQ